MGEELDNAIQQNAPGPKQAGADGVTTQQHLLPDEIEADNRRHWANADGVAADGAVHEMKKNFRCPL